MTVTAMMPARVRDAPRFSGPKHTRSKAAAQALRNNVEVKSMKKYVAMMMLAAILTMALFCASAEEEYTLHQGTAFGMSLNDVLLIEKAAGNELTEMARGDYNNWPIGAAFSTNETAYYAGGANAVGGLFGIINYLFDDSGTVTAFAYSTTKIGETIDCAELIEALTNKYGEPVAAVPDEFKDIGLGWDAMESVETTVAVLSDFRLTSMNGFHQWHYPYRGGCVDIQLVEYVLNYGGFMDTNCAMLSYTYRTPQEYDMFLNGSGTSAESTIEEDI